MNLTTSSVRRDASPQSFCLVAKILTPKTIKVDWVANVMKDAWIIRCPFSFSDYRSSMFLVRFGCEGDWRRVMEGQPWHFDRNLILFAIPDEFDSVVPSQVNFVPLWVQVHLITFGKISTDRAKFLSEQLGDLIEVHIASLYDTILPFIRIRVLIDVTKNFACEKLLKFCDVSPVPPFLSYKDVLRAPGKSVYKKSIFDLSNSTLFEESSSRSSVSNQSLHDAINQFLVPNLVNTSLSLDDLTNVPQSDHSTLGLSMTFSAPSFVGIPSLTCSLPVAPYYDNLGYF
ncbi:hypothetical protein F8388_023550 [Cannabis sativa]|uniref:DUF4283 domain-containing protein n=1 Tax=Cannabis sativa TaxID=3483 RepID=A0A7J6EG75_CANSA|nr:hypothetical protein F8388_023550 [Cannabis sativa]